jgi:hypothetical protein
MIQSQVISKILEKKPVVQKEAKVFSLNFKWVAAAAVVLDCWNYSFLGLMIIRRCRLPAKANCRLFTKSILQKKSIMADNNAIPNSFKLEAYRALKNVCCKSIRSLKSIETAVLTIPTDRIMPLKQRKAGSGSGKSSCGFYARPDERLDRNSEQDVYLDLYN